MSTIEFPGLGLKLTVSRVALEIFGVEIYWYGIIIAVALITAVLLGIRDSRKFGFEPDTVIDLVLFATPVAIVCSRLYYVIFAWESFRDNPLEIFNTRRGGLAIYGAVIGAVTVAYIFARKRKISVLRLFDFGAPYLPLGQAIGRWGNFINQEAYGVNTRLPWGMTSDTIKRDLLNNIDVLKAKGIDIDPNLPVHPTFLYESLWNIGVFLLLMWYRNRRKPEGEVFFLYMILYGIGRFWIEGLRTDSLLLGNMRVSQVLALVFAVVFGVVFYVRRRKAAQAALEETGIGSSEYGAILQHIKEEEEDSPKAEASPDQADKGTDGPG